MRENTITRVNEAQKRNLEAFQTWMRGVGVRRAVASVHPGSEVFRLMIEAPVGTPDSAIPQMAFGPADQIEGEIEMNPMEAFREIVRIAISHDDLIRDVAWMTGAVLTVPPSGPMRLDSETMHLRAPGGQVH